MAIKKLAPVTALLPLLAAPIAHGQPAADLESSYDFVVGGLAITELDSGGFELGGSFTIAPHVHLFGRYQDWELGETVDRSILQIGAGYYWDISQNLDLVAGASFAKSEIDFPIDDDGLILTAGLRGWITEQVELSSFLHLDDSLGSNVETAIEVGFQYFADSDFSLGARARVDEDDTTLFLGVRFYFRGNGQP